MKIYSLSKNKCISKKNYSLYCDKCCSRLLPQNQLTSHKIDNRKTSKTIGFKRGIRKNEKKNTEAIAFLNGS